MNVVVFNLCMHTLKLAPVRSGVISQVVAIGTNYLGNRYWTYRHSDKRRVRRETASFFFFSGIGLVIENGVLAISHYGLGHTSTLADNIAKNVVGLGIGTLFRFWAYRTWVFKSPEDSGGPGAGEGRDGQGSGGGAASGPEGGGEGTRQRTRSLRRLLVRRVAGRTRRFPPEEEGEDRRLLLK
ncbi:GtrA family protein [Actinacidiphila sp. SB3-2]